MKYFKIIFSFLTLVFLSTNVLAQDSKNEIHLPLGGNAFSSNNHENNNTITDNGIENWTNSKEYFTVYFRVSTPGLIRISTDENVTIQGKSTLEFGINKEFKKIEFDQSNKKPILIGEWKIVDTGYVALKIKGISKTQNSFPSISKLIIDGTALQGKVAYVPNNDDNFFHWGRRGPSVHLNYEVPEKVNVQWYYNEITVPVNEDKIGSYYMANGFGEGYFGIQVNSETERRVLFSVWSPFVTDDPKSIPDSHKIKMLKKGENVKTGEFGNEGSGGQSYLKYNWKAGTTYKFLLNGVPQNDNSTTYTAYFYAPEQKKWMLIASFNRPQTNTYLKRFHSFLENFVPQQGNKSRKVLFNNQWYCDDKGIWKEVDTATFTVDNTGRKGYRMDYSGGIEKGFFFLKDGGFFNQYTKAKTKFKKPLNHNMPSINFSTLP